MNRPLNDVAASASAMDTSPSPLVSYLATQANLAAESLKTILSLLDVVDQAIILMMLHMK